uniref:Uncharacterized protein LOC105125793 isoform X1 n=1 Tax=Rhizophora mucronata TaxID=61149 RepID=A0A2P2KYU8_RHIMU
MAQFAASPSPSCIIPRLCRASAKQSVCAPQTSLSTITHRKYLRGSDKVALLPGMKTKMQGAGISNLKASLRVRETSLGCACLGSLVNFDCETASDWLSVSDQWLLMTSILLTYVAGVIPIQKSNFTSQKKALDDNAVFESSKSSGRKNDDRASVNNAWTVVKNKLMYSLDNVENWSNLGNGVLGFEQQRTNQPLSLNALSEGPKMRLLWACFQRLEEEVRNILCDPDAVNMDNWVKIFPGVIEKSYRPIYVAWLEEECKLKKNTFDKEIITLIKKLKGDVNVIQNIRKSGKEDLYAELIYFLRFGSPRKSCCYDHSLFVLHGESILEDLVIALADGMASLYLELISVDSNLPSGMNSLGTVMCNFSTRALQRLRNEIALNQWLYQNMEAVVSIYEDRFDLCTFQLKVIEEASQNQTEKCSWWKKLTLRNSVISRSSVSYTVISQFSLPVKRTKELRELTGWYVFILWPFVFTHLQTA